MLVRPNIYLGASRRFADHDAAISAALKDKFTVFLEAHYAAWKALEYDHDALADFEGLLRDAWSDTWALVETDTDEAASRPSYTSAA